MDWSNIKKQTLFLPALSYTEILINLVKILRSYFIIINEKLHIRFSNYEIRYLFNDEKETILQHSLKIIHVQTFFHHL